MGLRGNSEVGAGAVLSHVRVCDRSVPEETAFLGNTLEEMMDRNKLKPEDLWDDDETYHWFARLLFPAPAEVDLSR